MFDAVSRLWRGIGVDRIAIGVSGLCLVHCVATALALALALSIGGLLVDPLIHETGLGIAILLGIVAFSQGWRVHGRLGPVLLGGLGFCAMAGAIFVRHGHPAEIPLTMVGVGLVAVAHLGNRRALIAR